MEAYYVVNEVCMFKKLAIATLAGILGLTSCGKPQESSYFMNKTGETRIFKLEGVSHKAIGTVFAIDINGDDVIDETVATPGISYNHLSDIVNYIPDVVHMVAKDVKPEDHYLKGRKANPTVMPEEYRKSITAICQSIYQQPGK
jgi:hypothetical protein